MRNIISTLESTKISDFNGQNEDLEDSVSEASTSSESDSMSEEKASDEPQIPLPSLLEVCLDTIGQKPSACLLSGSNRPHHHLAGVGDKLLTDMLISIVGRGNLTVEIVKLFRRVAAAEGRKEILNYLKVFKVEEAYRTYVPDPSFNF